MAVPNETPETTAKADVHHEQHVKEVHKETKKKKQPASWREVLKPAGVRAAIAGGAALLLVAALFLKGRSPQNADDHLVEVKRKGKKAARSAEKEGRDLWSSAKHTVKQKAGEVQDIAEDAFSDAEENGSNLLGTVKHAVVEGAEAARDKVGYLQENAVHEAVATGELVKEGAREGLHDAAYAVADAGEHTFADAKRKLLSAGAEARDQVEDAASQAKYEVQKATGTAPKDYGPFGIKKLFGGA